MKPVSPGAFIPDRFKESLSHHSTMTVMGGMIFITHNVYDVIMQLWKNTTLAPRDRLSLTWDKHYK